ncbi:hypothetical protein [Polyangium fumosum]|uniref:Uncharacterized protein n=1 Tax=Polyangium fumosum TaxID=889272 RepID=A0A4U1IYJ8_9BACT|nr:hypothetical protein [Polyangium fumosum]TKC99666.1 hypothetical protein E8A74_36920 [Polyangium fumosum]
MAFWSTADVELVSRVVTAKTKNDRRVRGKLTLHFAEAQTQGNADDAGDRCATLAEELFGEADDHEQLIGAEAELAAALRLRLPPRFPSIRSLDLAALHVVGDPSTSAALRRASTTTMRAVAGPVSTPAPNTIRGRSPSSMPPSGDAPSASFRVSQLAASTSGTFRAPISSAGPASGPISTSGPRSSSPPTRRGTLGRMRAIMPGMMLAPGAPPEAIGQALAPFVRDCAGRILVGFLRGYDLLALRGLALEEGSAEMLAALVPVSDAPLGGYEASRTSELARWQNAFGEAVFQRVRRESQVAAIYLAHMALGRLGVPPSVGLPILQEAAPSAFGGERGTVLEMARYVSIPAESFVPALCQHLVDTVGHGDATQLAAALAPLVTSVEEDMAIAATFARDASGV